jgi:EpsD family peptidyl-prolyl cis-trans isomerase
LRRSCVSRRVASQSETTSKLGLFRPLTATALVCTLGLAVAACKPGGPSGQVVATVNGKEVTTQDLLAESRASGSTQQTVQTLLQEVIARNLLAQSAHDQSLDAYPGYPSDLVRIQQAFLAEKALQKLMKPVAPPTPTDIAAFEAAHPFLFAQRVRAQVDEVRFETSDDLKSMQGVEDLPGVVAKLKSLNAPFDRKAQALDTSEMPDAMAAHIVAAPLNQLQFYREGNVVLGIVVLQRDPVVLPPEQESVVASGLIAKVAAQNQVNAELARLKAKAHIVYQKAYAPPAPATGASRG